VLIALPQALAYMLNDPNLTNLILVCLSMVGEFVFIKLIQQNQPQYDRYALSIEREDELYQVLSVLKRLGQLMIETDK